MVTYLEPTIWAVVQEGVFAPNPRLSASNYLRDLIVADLEKRGLLTDDIKGLMIRRGRENSAA